MSFQAYMKNIQSQTGKTPEEFFELAKIKGLAGEEVKAGQIVAWLKEEFGLGHGYCMALVRAFKFLRKGELLPQD